MLELLALIFSTIVLYPISFITHELSHVIGGFIQGSTRGTITVWRNTMTVSANKTPNYRLFLYMGGLLTGLVFLLLGIISRYYGALALEFPFITFGIMQILYGIFEGTTLPTWSATRYKIGRYSVYTFTFVLMLTLYWNKIVSIL